MLLLTLFFFFRCVLNVNSLTYSPSVTLYTGKNCDGDSVTIEGMHESSLRAMGWENQAHSVKMLGTWIFYERESFNSFGEGQTKHFIGDNTECVNSTILQLPGQISSLRYAGLPWSYNDDAINIYEVEEFQGDEVWSEKDLPHISTHFQASLIISGCSAWTMYDQPWYGGRATCINATEEGKPVLVTDIFDKKIPYDSIRSAKIGCFK